jgi:Eukaryotic initiation factor 4E
MTEVLSPGPPAEAMDKLSLDGQNAVSSSTSANNPGTVIINEPLTVFHDPKNFNVKHPLMNAWTLWFTKTPTATGPKESWADLLKEVITFDSVEEFWGCISNLIQQLTLTGFSIISPRHPRSLSNRITHFSKRVFVLNGRIRPMKKEVNGVFNSRGIPVLMSCGFTLYILQISHF